MKYDYVFECEIKIVLHIGPNNEVYGEMCKLNITDLGLVLYSFSINKYYIFNMHKEPAKIN